MIMKKEIYFLKKWFGNLYQKYYWSIRKKLSKITPSLIKSCDIRKKCDLKMVVITHCAFHYVVIIYTNNKNNEIFDRKQAGWQAVW